jgi:hypothetical protein
MYQTFLKPRYLLLLFLCTVTLCHCYRKYSYNIVSDPKLIENEVAFVKALKTTKAINDTNNNYELSEIPMINCTDSLVTFSKGNFIANDKLINIFVDDFNRENYKFSKKYNQIQINNRRIFGTAGTMPRKRIKAVRVLYGEHRIVSIPDSAYYDLFEPNICENGDQMKLRCKVYQSKDKQRVYIYMINGEAGNLYEVVWIIIQGKYYSRWVNVV